MKLKLFNRIEVDIHRVNNLNRVPKYRDPIVQPRMPNSSLDNFYVHLHIPKTGGTTFNSVLEKNFGIAYEAFIGRLVHEVQPFEADQIESYISKHPGMRCISSHLFRAYLPYQSPEKNVIGLAFIRDPIDKFLSFYFHMRHRYGVKCIEKELNLEDYIELKSTHIPKGYLHHLCGEESDNAFDYIKALIQSKNLFIFSTYQMKEACEFLHSTFPDDFHDISFSRENISTKDQDVTPNMRSQIKEIVSPYDWKLLELAKSTI